MGHTVGHSFHRPSDLKTIAVAEHPKPLTKTDIRFLLGITGYYQHYIRDYTHIASPLKDALRKVEQQLVVCRNLMANFFRALQSKLTSQPLLRWPDYNRSFILQCDTSDQDMGAVLSQEDDGANELPVLLISRKLTNYTRGGL